MTAINVDANDHLHTSLTSLFDDRSQSPQRGYFVRQELKYVEAEFVRIRSRCARFASTHTIADLESAGSPMEARVASVWRGVVGCGCEFG